MDFAVDNIPPFANERVREKFQALDEAKSRLSSSDSSVFAIRQRIKLMEEHAVNVGNELTELQHVVSNFIQLENDDDS